MATRSRLRVEVSRVLWMSIETMVCMVKSDSRGVRYCSRRAINLENSKGPGGVLWFNILRWMENRLVAVGKVRIYRSSQHQRRYQMNKERMFNDCWKFGPLVNIGYFCHPSRYDAGSHRAWE